MHTAARVCVFVRVYERVYMCERESVCVSSCAHVGVNVCAREGVCARVRGCSLSNSVYVASHLRESYDDAFAMGSFSQEMLGTKNANQANRIGVHT